MDKGWLSISREDLILLRDESSLSSFNLIMLMCDPRFGDRIAVDFPKKGDTILTNFGAEVVKNSHECDWIHVILKRGETNGTEGR